MGAMVGAVGAFLLVFGFLFLILSPSFVYALIGFRNTQAATAWLELIGLVLASLGAGLLAFGVLSRGHQSSPQV